MFQFFKDLAAAITGINDLIDKLNTGEITIRINLYVNDEKVVLPPVTPPVA